MKNVQTLNTKLIVLTVLSLVAASCRLTSTTNIEANQTFLLGNNPHGVFRARVKNISKNDVTVYRAPIDGGRHSFETIKPGETIKVKVERNTALVINNASNQSASVELLVSGDLGLSMGYNK
jgi:hypothetical protein